MMNYLSYFRFVMLVGRLIVILFIFLLIAPVNVSAQEATATELEMSAEDLERQGDKDAATANRQKALIIRKRNFGWDSFKASNFRDPASIPPDPFSAGKRKLFAGYLEVGIRGNVPIADFNSGQDWALDNGRVALQAGSPYFPRSFLPYQNESVLPFNNEPTRIRPEQAHFPTLKINYVAESKKWGLEYSNLPFSSAYGYTAYGFNNQLAQYETRFNMQDHRLMVKILEEQIKERWFSWDFGVRAGGWNTNSSFVYPSLNQAGDLKETARFIAPSVGFRIYQTVLDLGRIEFGSDVFYTTGGTLNYQRTYSRDGRYDQAGNLINGSRIYKIESANPLELTITGFDVNLIYSFLLGDHSRFSLGAKTTGYTWRANETHRTGFGLPRFTALSQDAMVQAISDWYRSSAIYEADGDGKRASRYFNITNFFIGYSYVF